MGKYDRWATEAVDILAFPLLPLTLLIDFLQLLFFVFADLDLHERGIGERMEAELQRAKAAELACAEEKERRLRERDAIESKLNFKIVDAASREDCEAEVSRLLGRGWVLDGNLQHDTWLKAFDNGTYDGSGHYRCHSYKQPMRRNAPVAA